MKRRIIVGVVILAVIIFLVNIIGNDDKQPPLVPENKTVCGDRICDQGEACESDCTNVLTQAHAKDIAHVPKGWSAPVRVAASDSGWEDSA